MAIALRPDETDDLLRLGLHRLPIGDLPLLRGLTPVLVAYDGAAELERGPDILLTGLATTLPPPDRARNAGASPEPPRTDPAPAARRTPATPPQAGLIGQDGP